MSKFALLIVAVSLLYNFQSCACHASDVFDHETQFRRLDNDPPKLGDLEHIALRLLQALLRPSPFVLGRQAPRPLYAGPPAPVPPPPPEFPPGPPHLPEFLPGPPPTFLPGPAPPAFLPGPPHPEFLPGPPVSPVFYPGIPPPPFFPGLPSSGVLPPPPPRGLAPFPPGSDFDFVMEYHIIQHGHYVSHPNEPLSTPQTDLGRSLDDEYVPEFFPRQEEPSATVSRSNKKLTYSPPAYRQLSRPSKTPSSAHSDPFPHDASSRSNIKLRYKPPAYLNLLRRNSPSSSAMSNQEQPINEDLFPPQANDVFSRSNEKLRYKPPAYTQFSRSNLPLSSAKSDQERLVADDNLSEHFLPQDEPYSDASSRSSNKLRYKPPAYDAQEPEDFPEHAEQRPSFEEGTSRIFRPVGSADKFFADDKPIPPSWETFGRDYEELPDNFL